MWTGYFNPDWCQGVVSRGLALKPQEAVVGRDEAGRLDLEYRTSKIRWLKRPQWDYVANEMESLVKTANNSAFGFDLNFLKEIQFTEYDSTDKGHYDWHEDVFWKGNTSHHRKLSIVIQLTDPDEYEGGELELEHEPPEQMALRQQGTVIVFPSFHPHRVTNITKGIRHSIVGWYEGPKFR